MTDVTGARILIIDDQEPNVRLLERILRRAGYGTFATTTDPRLAPALYLQFQPDVVLLDLRMRPIDGLELLKQFDAARGRHGSSAILVMSADVSDTVRRQVLSLGASDFLTKPFGIDDVQRGVKRLLEGSGWSHRSGPRPLPRTPTSDHHLEGRPFTNARSTDPGSISGDVAHDLCNVLSVIRNFATLVVAGVEQQIASPAPGRWAEIRQDAEEIRVAAERSEALSARLLAGGLGGVDTR